jgi:peptide/nickel transport system permease protein
MLLIVALTVGGWMLGMRNVMITTVQEDYVTMAQAKGLSDRRVMTSYAARNAILPPLTAFASLFASAVGGLILVEVVFSYPGVGLTLQQAALGHDYPVVQALLLVIAFCVLLANFIIDCVYVFLDPRVRAS